MIAFEMGILGSSNDGYRCGVAAVRCFDKYAIDMWVGRGMA